MIKEYWAVLGGVPNPRSGRYDIVILTHKWILKILSPHIRIAAPLKELGQGMAVAESLAGNSLMPPIVMV